MRLFADYHTHTRYSHGRGSVWDNAVAARVRGLSEIAVADHGPANLFGVGVDSLATFAAIGREVKVANDRLEKVRILFAVEANVVGKKGELDIPTPMQETFDLVLAGLHIMVRPRSWCDALGIAAKNMQGRITGNTRAALVVNTDLLVAAVYNNRVAIVTHPGLKLPVDTAELARACAATGTAMEINAGHRHTDLRYIEVAAQEGARFAINSDAHAPDRVGDLKYGLALAKEAGLTAAQVINAAREG